MVIICQGKPSSHESLFRRASNVGQYPNAVRDRSERGNAFGNTGYNLRNGYYNLGQSYNPCQPIQYRPVGRTDGQAASTDGSVPGNEFDNTVYSLHHGYYYSRDPCKLFGPI